MTSTPQSQFARIERLPPYVFNITTELKMEARRRGEDIIDFGMGNPDGPTPPHIVAKLVETVQRVDTHGYSVSKGIPRLRRAICHWYDRRWGVSFDPETEAIVTIGSKEGIAHLALATLGLAESVRMFIGVTDYLGASIGFGDIPPPMIGDHRLDSYYAYYYIVMPIAFIGTYLAYSILRSDVGRAFMAIREDSLAAAAAGIKVRKYKLLAFVISAFYAGCAGSLAAHMAPGFIHPDDYNLTRMVTVILMVVAGGLGHIWGCVIGAALITLIAEWSRAYYQYEFIIFGMIVVLTMMYMPRGIGGYLDRRRVRRRFVALRGQGGPQGTVSAAVGAGAVGTGAVRGDDRVA